MIERLYNTKTGPSSLDCFKQMHCTIHLFLFCFFCAGEGINSNVDASLILQ